MLGGGGDELGFFARGRREHVHGEHDVGLGQARRRTELASIDGDGVHELRRGEMGGEGEGQAKRGGHLSTIEAAAENPQRHLEPRAGNRFYRGAGRGSEVLGQFLNIAREFIRIGGQVPTQGTGGDLVGPRGAPEP